MNAVVPPTGGNRPKLQVHLALGNLSTRARAPWDGARRSPAEPLGFATDPRWIWHEIAHVLLMAALGELEFRFAHSMGDALAAIVADPCSELVRSLEWRGYTFPWVFSPRRHDRCVLHGWGWSGTLGRTLRELPDIERLRRKGYWTEQILSTSLFRLYRCLGGDTVQPTTAEPDRAARKLASDYTVHLILTALQELGDPRVVPAAKPELFQAALCDADESTGTCPTEDGHGNIVTHIGGCAQKVIRWAFEAQGMFAANPDVIHDAPGLPSPVDVYIRDGRPEVEILPGAMVRHGPGAYVPVSLDWGGLIEGLPDAAPPRWFADGQAIRPTNGGFEVTVSNRGSSVAPGVTVRLWYRDWPDGTPPPPWEEGAWILAGISPAKDIAPGAFEVFGPLPLPADAARRLVLAEAGCIADRANIDPVTGLACTQNPTPLNTLVPSDNNLGLAVFPP